MVFRVLAGVVPMLLGALIYSGAIPVRQWVFGQADPVRAIAAAAANNPNVQFPSPGEIFSTGPGGTMPTMAMDPAQAQLIREHARLTQAQLRRQVRDHGSRAQAGSWEPSGDWQAETR